MEQQQSAFWAIVELMGHRTLAGEVHPMELAGHGYLRVEIPETGTVAAWNKILAPGAVYGLTPVDEALARSVAERLQERPLTLYSAGDLGRDLYHEAERRIAAAQPCVGHDETDDGPI